MSAMTNISVVVTDLCNHDCGCRHSSTENKKKKYRVTISKYGANVWSLSPCKDNGAKYKIQYCD